MWAEQRDGRKQTAAADEFTYKRVEGKLELLEE